MTVPEDQIAELSIDLTVVDGKVVYDRSKDGIIRLDFWDGTGEGEGLATSPPIPGR
jgi:hypothetical protein